MNQTEFWKLPKLPHVEFFKAQFTNFSYAPHFHEAYAIGVVETGIHAFHYRHENFAITPDHVITYQPGEIHDGHPGSDSLWRYRMLYLQPSLVYQIASELGYQPACLPFLSHTSISHPLIVQAVRMLHQQSEQREPTLSLEVQLRETLALVLANFSEMPLNPRAITDEKTPIECVKHYMQAHYADDVQLDDLIQIAHLSKSYFIRAFRHHQGISPYAYLVQVRLNRAKTLLERGLSSTEVAQETGFFDQSHLNKYFKRFLGITPGSYQIAVSPQ
jgi:AraC-like DNA-binding protein